MRRILLAYASSHGQTRKIADAIAAELRTYGHLVELSSVFAGEPPPPHEFDAVVLGSRVQFAKHAQPIVDYIRAWHAELRDMPSYFFSVSNARAHQYVETLFETTGWRARIAASFAGGLPYRQYNVLLRFVMKQISKHEGRPTDTTRDHELTDWTAVKRFARDIAQDLARPTYRIDVHAQA